MKRLPLILTTVIVVCVAVLGGLLPNIHWSLWEESQAAMVAFIGIGAVVIALMTRRESWLVRVTSVILTIAVLVLTIEVIRVLAW